MEGKTMKLEEIKSKTKEAVDFLVAALESGHSEVLTAYLGAMAKLEVLLNIPEPRRTLTLSDAATALRVSELLGDVDGSRLRRIGDVRSQSLCLGKIQSSKVQGFEGTGSHASVYWRGSCSPGASGRVIPKTTTTYFRA
jgi:hypothetical protein